jgi:hypothetical protein
MSENTDAAPKGGAALVNKFGDKITSPQPSKLQAPDPDRDHLLAGLRSARSKMAAYTAELDSVGTALSRNVVDVDEALCWLSNIGALVLFDLRDPQEAQ